MDTNREEDFTPAVDVNKKENSIISVSLSNKENKEKPLYTNSNTEDKLSESEKEKEEIQGFPEELIYLLFGDAILEDEILYFYSPIIIEKDILMSIIINNFCFFSSLTLKYIFLIYNLDLLFIFNCFLFSESYIRKRFNFVGKVNVVYLFKYEILKSFYSSILAYIFSKATWIVIVMTRKFLLASKIKKEKNQNIYSLIKNFKIRLAIFFLIIIVISLISYYFVTLFCLIYTKNQVNLIISFSISTIFEWLLSLLSLLICFLVGTFKYLASREKYK